MALRVDYLARETGQNLVRNPLLSAATVLTVWVSLGMLAVTVLTGFGIDNAFERWNNDVSFIVYMNPDASKDVVDKIGKELEASPQVASVTYIDDKKTYDLFRRLFPDDPTLLGTVKPGDLPTSFRVKPENPNAQAVRALGESFRAKPGVYGVDFPEELVKTVQRGATKLRTAALVGAIALLIASILMIFVAIQTAVFARRREIEVMKLVGATNWFIRIPFILEGLIQCLAGAVLASLSAWGFSRWWRGAFSGQSTANLLDQIRWTTSEFNTTVIVVVIVGALVGAIASTVSVTWYLRV